MLRLIIDKLGNGHHDLFLKVDLIPEFSKTADSYYLGDFLEISETDILYKKEQNSLQYLAIQLIEYWIERIQSINKYEEKFIPFDLSDQYVGGFMMKKVKLGYKVKFVFTDQIQGPGVIKSTLDDQFIETKSTFKQEKDIEYLLGEEALFQGLEWSIKELTF